MAQKAPQKTSEAQPQAAGAGTDISINNIVKLFKEMPAEFKDEIRKELGASGIVREKRRRRSTNEGAASLVHTVGDVLHPPGHVAKPPEWVIEKGEHFRATWESSGIWAGLISPRAIWRMSMMATRAPMAWWVSWA